MNQEKTEAWRAGWRAAVEAVAAVVETRAQGREDVSPYGLEIMAQDIRAMQPPENAP